MKAWQMEKELMEKAIPKLLTEEEQGWSAIEPLEKAEDARIKLWWYSEVPGSGAPERLIIAAIQSMENKGFQVEEAEALIQPGLKAFQEDDMASLHRISGQIFHLLNQAPVNEASPYWKYAAYTSWDQLKQAANFPASVSFDVTQASFQDQLYAGWLAQIIGGAIGTAMEGYTTHQLKKAFGKVDGYVRKPNTFNDDITYELAFLKAFESKGFQISAADIADQWLALVPFGWSAEDIALRNLKLGIYPPESGTLHNPFSDWIGAQMRGAVCGMVAPGNAEEAARLAWLDGSISHANNGILGEVFNAVLTARAFVTTHMPSLVEEVVAMMPKDAEYTSVVNFALEQCRKTNQWETAWRACEEKYEAYNWIHAYPNAAAQVVALWFGHNDFNETMNIIALAGQDVDCNAAQIATMLGIARGVESIDAKWRDPIGDQLDTYLRGMKQMTISGLARWTAAVAQKAAIGAIHESPGKATS
ncbi:ADP-ribosylglycohydrolase family protein [Anoxynatronum buryatiense]|uniref:ADP-ribosylglycohydrolase n=1 Tax=Anoxynatronum buryatiense TaxID=489973 RepID=A0AA45WSN9_9CLOT|nr:ADP-ribosylglycohydrolase family protein [Anoxynatronum buryatiense]SMP38796.1 ADP-ribosylglycohydrolase [Anoxynatronum buryatiense]